MLAELTPVELLSCLPRTYIATCHSFSPLALPLSWLHAASLPPHKLSGLRKGGGSPREAKRTATFQHADMHGIIGFLWDTEHHLQAILELPFSFFTAS